MVEVDVRGDRWMVESQVQELGHDQTFKDDGRFENSSTQRYERRPTVMELEDGVGGWRITYWNIKEGGQFGQDYRHAGLRAEDRERWDQAFEAHAKAQWRERSEAGASWRV